MVVIMGLTPYMTFLFAFNHILQKMSLPSVGSMLSSLHYLMNCVGINAPSIKSFFYQTNEMKILMRKKLLRRKI